MRGSSRSDIEHPAWRRVGYVAPGRPRQSTPPEFPRSFVDPARLSGKHDLDETIIPKTLLQLAHIGKPSETHRLRNDSVIRAGLQTHRLPPEELRLQVG